MNFTFSLTPRARARATVLLPLGAAGAALLVGLALIALTGAPLGTALAAFLEGTMGSPYAIAASLNRALALALIGTGFVLADRARLTNVGGEGQIALGGMAATAVSLYGGVEHLPAGLPFLLPLLAAGLAGACWGGIAGVLKARAGTNEVISTLMLSFIGVWLLYWSVQSENLLRQPMSNSGTLPESPEIPLATHLPWFFGDDAMPLHLGLPLAILLGLATAWLLGHTLFGVHLRAVGLNPLAARRAGMPIARTIVLAMGLAGALGGIAGAVMLQGDQHSLKAGFSSGYGFDGLVVGLLARGSVSGVFAGALLFGFLRSGGISMEMVASVPSALVLVVQGVIILTVAGAAFVTRQGVRA